MTDLQLSTEIQHDLGKLVERGVRAIVAATEAMSRELRETHIPNEAPTGPSGDLSNPANWLEREVDPLTRIVYPGAAAFYAHIVAGGRGDVAPQRAKALTIGGRFAAAAGPHSGNPFQDRAVDALERQADSLLAAAMQEA